MPLSRELCKALHGLFPEVRNHGMNPGDLWWHGTDLSVVVPAAEDAVDLVLIEKSGRQDKRRTGLFWCPSLSDLLAMARARLGGQVLILEVGWKQEDPADDDIADCFCFTYVCGVGEHSIQHSADAPEEAVARWLLEHTESSRPR